MSYLREREFKSADRKRWQKQTESKISFTSWSDLSYQKWAQNTRSLWDWAKSNQSLLFVSKPVNYFINPASFSILPRKLNWSPNNWANATGNLFFLSFTISLSTTKKSPFKTSIHLKLYVSAFLSLRVMRACKKASKRSYGYNIFRRSFPRRVSAKKLEENQKWNSIFNYCKGLEDDLQLGALQNLFEGWEWIWLQKETFGGPWLIHLTLFACLRRSFVWPNTTSKTLRHGSLFDSKKHAVHSEQIHNDDKPWFW